MTTPAADSLPSERNTVSAESDAGVVLRSGATCAFWIGLSLILMLGFASRPLWHTDLWDHVNYGEHIIATGRIPASEPLLPMAAGQVMTNFAWGSQVLLAWIVGQDGSGLPLLQYLHGLCVAAAAGFVGWTVIRQGGPVPFAISAYLLFVWVNWQQLIVIRPQLIGVVFYCVVLNALQRSPPGRTVISRSKSGLALIVLRGVSRLVAVALVFGLWANLHGSFAIGLALVGMSLCGCWLDVWTRTGSLRRAFRHSEVRWRLLLIAACSFGSLINPYGPSIFFAVSKVGRHANISSMYEWAPLTLQMKQGQAAAMASLICVVVCCVTPRRPRAAELLPLFVTGVLMLWSSRMINWFAPVAAVFASLHAGAIWKRLWKLPARDSGLRIHCTPLILIALIFLGCFSQTNYGRQLWFGKEFALADLTSVQTPVETASFLNSLDPAPAGLCFFPAEWSGFLMWSGPDTLKPMVNLHVHVIPEDVWQDYLRLHRGNADCRQILDSYGIDLIVTDVRRQPEFTRKLDGSANYKAVYRDLQASVFVRRARGKE